MFGTSITSVAMEDLKVLVAVERQIDLWLKENWTSGTAEVPLTAAQITANVETLLESRYVAAGWATATVSETKDTLTLTTS